MFPRKGVPDSLKTGPVSRAEMLAAGVSPSQLRGPSWKRIARGIYAWTGLANERLIDPVGLAHRALAAADGRSESPMESRLRVILIDGGLPPPETQVWVGDRRIDMAYRDVKLGIEYDGDTHRERLVEDNRRQNWLVAVGYVLLRFTAADVYHRPAAIVSEVGAQLRARRHQPS